MRITYHSCILPAGRRATQQRQNPGRVKYSTSDEGLHPSCIDSVRGLRPSSRRKIASAAQPLDSFQINLLCLKVERTCRTLC